MSDSKVKEVRLYKNAISANHRTKMAFPMKNYIEIEFMDGNIIKLDCERGLDLTNIDYIEIPIKGKLKK